LKYSAICCVIICVLIGVIIMFLQAKIGIISESYKFLSCFLCRFGRIL